MTAISHNIITRFLQKADIESLLILEKSKWEDDQSADRETLLKRIETYPELCIGAFCAQTGTALASLFMKPTTLEDLNIQPTWKKLLPYRKQRILTKAPHYLN